MRKLPKDCSARAIGTRVRSIVPYKLNSELWDWHELTGTDHGTDMIIEYIDSNEFWNDKIECQIKGTKSLKKLDNGDISFNIDIKTLNYALGCPNAFVLFLVDVNTENVYYLPIQDCFINDKNLFQRIDRNKKTVAMHIPQSNILDEECSILEKLAKKTYVFGPSKELKEYVRMTN